MISAKVDLTLHRDFNEERHIPFRKDITDLSDLEFMSNTDYESLYEWEKIFGRRYRSEKHMVFKKDDAYYINDMQTHCARCGKELKIPWKRQLSDLCDDCDEIVSKDYPHIPWRILKIVRADDMGDDREIFNLK